LWRSDLEWQDGQGQPQQLSDLSHLGSPSYASGHSDLILGTLSPQWDFCSPRSALPLPADSPSNAPAKPLDEH
jgi:hypothetical protein